MVDNSVIVDGWWIGGCPVACAWMAVRSFVMSWAVLQSSTDGKSANRALPLQGTIDSRVSGKATEIFIEDEVVIFSFFSLIHRVNYAARIPDMSY